MITHTPAKVHWNYFIALEQDVEVAARYVEPVPANFGTYSLEMCRILFAACAECEVVLKQLASRYATGTEGFDIEDLRRKIMQNLPAVADEKVFVRRYGLELDPWSNWRAGSSPDWWKSYNHVKHHRALKYSEGNLKNALNAVAALMVAVVHFYRHELSPASPLMDIRDLMEALSPDSRLFFLADDRYPDFLRLS
jgi:hypothetical protein